MNCFFCKSEIPDDFINSIEDHDDVEKACAENQLMVELKKGRRSGEEQGWLSESDIKIS